MDAKIFIIGHKPVPYGFWEDELYQPIQVGNADTFLSLRDNTGDNISSWNSVWAENTAHYWIAHNTNYKYTGVCHYRRRLKIDKYPDLDTLFKYYYAIAPIPLNFGNITLRQQYEYWHCKEDIDIVECIVKIKYPEYSDDWDRVVNDGNILFYASSVIMKTDDFKKYVDFLYDVGTEWLRIKRLNKPEDVRKMVESDLESGKRPYNDGGHVGEFVRYQTQILGFIAERLLTFWLMKDRKPILLTDFEKFEVC